MAQLRDHPAVIGKNDFFRVDPRQLRVDPGFNVRDLETPAARTALDDLKSLILGAGGVLVPLEIRIAKDDTLYITSGHRRHKAVLELIAEGHEILTVPATAEPKTVNDSERVARLIDLNGGEPLSQLEKAEVVRRLLGFGWERNRIAQRYGWTAQTVAHLEETLALPEAIKDHVREGAISATTARQVVREQGPEAATETIREARVTAKASGRSKVTPKSFVRPTQPAARSRDTLSALIATLKEIAVSGDGPRDRHQARLCLKYQSIDCPPEAEDAPDSAPDAAA